MVILSCFYLRIIQKVAGSIEQSCLKTDIDCRNVARCRNADICFCWTLEANAQSRWNAGKIMKPSPANDLPKFRAKLEAFSNKFLSYE